VTDGVMSRPVSLLQKISAAMDNLCQTALKQNLQHKCEKWSKFSSWSNTMQKEIV